LHFDPLFDDHFLLAGSQRRLMDVPEHVLPDQLGDAQMILLEDGHCLTDQALEVCGRDKNHAQINLGAVVNGDLNPIGGGGFWPDLNARNRGPVRAVWARCGSVTPFQRG
jgi:LysR family hydrogen peroxide-inducible transcriptional activator